MEYIIEYKKTNYVKIGGWCKSTTLHVFTGAPDCAYFKYQFSKYFKTAFSSHDVCCGGFCMFLMISSDCFPTNTNQCVSEMDNHVFALKWELFCVI